MRFLLRLIVTAAALWVAVTFVPGLEYRGGLLGLLCLALIFGIVNALVRPLLLLLTCPLVVLTLGIFILVLNGLMLWLTAHFASALGISFHIAGLIPAIIGALVVSVVSMLLSIFVREPKH